ADTHAWGWRLTEAGQTALPRLRGKPRRLAELLEEAARDEDALADLLDDWRAAARALAGRGLLERFALPRRAGEPGSVRSAPVLNPVQQSAVDALLAAREGFAPFLLDGVTGS